MKRHLAAVAAAALLSAATPVFAGSVSGRLVDAGGKPVPAARVRWSAFRTDDQQILDGSKLTEPAVLGETSTGPDGRFRVVLDGPDLSVSLRISAPGSPSIRVAGPFDSSDDASLDDVHAPAAEKMTGRVVDEQNKPVSGARVRVVANDPFSDQDVDAFGEARTGEDGSFRVPDAPGGARTITVRAPGLVPATQFQMDSKPDVRISLKRGGSIRGVVLDAAGKPAAGALVIAEEQAVETDAQGAFAVAGIDAGVRSIQAYWKEDFAVRRDNVRIKRAAETEVPLKLAKAAAVGGTVIDETTRRPVAGAHVGASSGGFAFGRRRTERTARTDARGRFRVTGLAPRAYAMTASREGYLSSSINGIAASTSAPGTVHIALAKAASISGKVVDEAGAGVAGARVAIATDFNLRAFARRGARAAMGPGGTLSGPDGSFRIRNLSAGRNLALEASKPAYATARRPGVTLKTGDAVANVSLVLRKGIEAKGRVLDAEGKPVAGAEIRVATRDGGFPGGGRAQIRLMGLDNSRPDATSGPDGTFTVRGLDAGVYTAAAARDGYARKTASGLSVKAAEENVWPPIVLTNGVALAGFVRDSAGQPIAGAQLFAISLGEGMRPQNTSTDADGRFRVDGLAAEKSLLLNVSAPGFAGTQKNVSPPAEDLVIVLKTAGAVRGRVEDGDTKRPITDFTIARTAQRGGGGAQFQFNFGGQNGEKAFQSEDGSFELPDVPAGKWTIRASAAGYRAGEASGVEIAEAETREGVVVSLRRGGSLSGRVLDPREGAVANASVSWQAAGSSTAGPFARMGGGAAASSATTTDADGKFQFDGLPEGRVTITADHADFLEGTRDVDPSKEQTVDISLGTGGAISGTVVAADGRTPVGGALVSLNQEGDANNFTGSDSARTDGSGAFLFEHLKAGRFKLTAQAATGKSSAKVVILADSQRQDGVQISMSSGGATVRGTIIGLPPGKLGGVRVNASAPDYGDATQSDDAGAFVLQNVPAGVIRFQARTEIISGRTAVRTVEVPDGGGDFPVEILFEGTSHLTGRVTRGDKPLSNLFVSANADPPTATGGRATAQTDDDGRYSMEGLADGTYQVSASGQGVSSRKTVAVSGDTTSDFQISMASISGNVVEDGSGQPIEGATVQASTGNAPGAVKRASTDSSGHYEIDGVDPGAYTVSARKSGYQQKSQSATVAADPASADFSLPKGSGVTIQVTDGTTGLPLHGVNALALGPGSAVAFEGSVNLDSTGRGEIPSLSPGRYAIYVFSDGYAPRSVGAVDAPSPGVAVAMTPGGRVEVHSGMPSTGRVTDGSGSLYLFSAFRMDGRVNVLPPVGLWEHFAPGSYTLTLTGVSGQQTYTFAVAEGQTTRLDLK